MKDIKIVLQNAITSCNYAEVVKLLKDSAQAESLLRQRFSDGRTPLTLALHLLDENERCRTQAMMLGAEGMAGATFVVLQQEGLQARQLRQIARYIISIMPCGLLLTSDGTGQTPYQVMPGFFNPSLEQLALTVKTRRLYAKDGKDGVKSIYDIHPDLLHMPNPDLSNQSALVYAYKLSPDNSFFWRMVSLFPELEQTKVSSHIESVVNQETPSRLDTWLAEVRTDMTRWFNQFKVAPKAASSPSERTRLLLGGDDPDSSSDEGLRGVSRTNG